MATASKRQTRSRKPPRSSGTGRAPAREALVAYFADLARTPRLDREEERRLAQELERATAALRLAIYAVPVCADWVVAHWTCLKAEGRTSARLSEDGTAASEADLECLEDTLAKLEQIVAVRGGVAAPERRSLDEQAATLLLDANLSLELLRQLLRRLRAERSRLPRVEARAAARKWGLPPADFEARMGAVEAAFVDMTTFKDQLIVHYLPLVVSVAKDFRHLGLAFGDLIQEGNAGLIRAVERFDWRRGTYFTTFAVWWIRHGVVRAIQNHSRTVRVPGHRFDDARAQRRERTRLESVLGRSVTQDELASALQVPLSQVEDLERCFADPLSLEADHRFQMDTPRRLVDVLEDSETRDPSEEIDRSILGGHARRMIQELPERERTILRYRFGLEGEREHTLKEVGARLGLSGERVRQLEAGALGKLQRRAEIAGERGSWA
ncbi:MAG: RNA polymerase sigma factor RpoD/SigA [Myxococcales bacterium]|nr:RNA polymerase sigma factor RpoD/SigA [Myxococcales bacterium]